MKKPLLLLGLGNTLMSDDGAGIHVINELRRHKLPDGVDIVDGGTGGISLIDILSGYGTVFIADAVRGVHSRITVFSPDELGVNKKETGFSVHEVELGSVLELMNVLGMDMPDIKIVGIPAENLAPGTVLSEGCRNLVAEAVDIVIEMVEILLKMPECPAL